MIGSFTFENLPYRVLFGSGTLSAAKAEIERLGGNRALVLTTPQQEAQGAKLGSALGPLYAGVFAGATMHTPIEVTERALAAMKACDADCVVSADRRPASARRSPCAQASTSSAFPPPMPAPR
jgi:maleylacetate reductase